MHFLFWSNFRFIEKLQRKSSSPHPWCLLLPYSFLVHSSKLRNQYWPITLAPDFIQSLPVCPSTSFLCPRTQYVIPHQLVVMSPSCCDSPSSLLWVLRGTDQFVECPSIWVCLIFTHGQTGITRFLKNSTNVKCLSYPIIRGHMIIHMSSLVMSTLFTSLRSYWPGFSSVSFPGSFSLFTLLWFLNFVVCWL